MQRRFPRLVGCLALCLLAYFLAHEFVEYRVEPIHMYPHSQDNIALPKDELIFLGRTSIAAESGSQLARFHGSTAAERGIFARGNYTTLTATIGGILVPILLLGSAGCLLASIPRSKLRGHNTDPPEVSRA